jgi:hypothetical protein
MNNYGDKIEHLFTDMDAQRRPTIGNAPKEGVCVVHGGQRCALNWKAGADIMFIGMSCQPVSNVRPGRFDVDGPTSVSLHAQYKVYDMVIDILRDRDFEGVVIEEVEGFHRSVDGGPTPLDQFAQKIRNLRKYAMKLLKLDCYDLGVKFSRKRRGQLAICVCLELCFDQQQSCNNKLTAT